MRKLYALFTCLLFFTGSLLAQKQITGKVTDEKGVVLPNATVTIKGTNQATVTDAEGRFSINVPASARTLVFSSVGMSAQEITIGALAIINAALVTSTTSTLTEVIVSTGYQTRRRTEFTGASSGVSGKDIEQLPLASFEQALQGQAAGVYIASGSGQPGAAARVNIRGVGSFGNVDPLYVIDGVPIEANIFQTLNPNDFESIDILKDAAGAGQYGSRGANGVVVITTKRGRIGKTAVSYRGQAGFSEPPQQLNLRMMNTAERLQYEEKVLGGPNGILSSTTVTNYPGWDYSPTNPRYLTLTAAQRATEAASLDSVRSINTDWPALFFRKGQFTQHEVNASGGSQGLNFYTSLSYYKQEGVLIRSGLERYTFRTNLDFKKDRLSVSLRTAAGFSQLSNVESEAAIALANPIGAAYLELPYQRLYLPNGKINTGTGRTAPNAYDRSNTTTSLVNQFKGNLAITAQFDIWGGIAFRTTNGVDWRNNNGSRFIDPNSYAGSIDRIPTGVGVGQGSYNETNSERLQLISTTGFAFSQTYNSKHSINALAMMESIRNRNRNNTFTGYGINNRLLNTPAGITAGSATNNLIPVVGGSRSFNGLFSLFTLTDYTYDRKYTISGSLRRDVPSQLPKKNRDNVYWTAGASWNVSAEDFMAGQPVFQDVRLRGSYGEVANINGLSPNLNGLGGDFGYIPSYGGGSYAGVSGIVPTSPGNPEYKLETQVITDMGLELALWQRRIRFTADFFVKNSRNLFLNQEISRTTGFSSLRTNVGKMKNRGYEFDLRVDAIKSKDLTVTVSANGAPLKNRIISLGQITELAAGTGILRVGLPFGTHYAVGYLGVDPQTGLPIYQDLSGKPTSTYLATNSLADFGTYLPSFTGGAGVDVSWKGFALSTLFYTAQGVKRYDNESFFYETTNSNMAFNKRVDMLTTWQKPGDITNYQRISATRQFSSKDIRDASFVRFRNMTVGYTYTMKESKYLRSVRVWGQGQNLYTWTKWTGFDPEESNNIATYEFPNPRTYTIGLDVNF